MKKVIGLLFCFSIFTFNVCSQSSNSIIDELNSVKQGQGSITIYQDDVIKNLVNPPKKNTTSIETVSNVGNNNTNTNVEKNNSIVSSTNNSAKTRGYKIQVYSGNDQRKSRDEAYSRRDDVRRVYPQMNVSITYHSPAWRVRAGNFRSRAEAEQVLHEMRSKFPSFGKEMHIVDGI